MIEKSAKQKRALLVAPDAKQLLQALVIVAVGWWIYWPALRGDWLWDDDTDITGNSITRSATGLWSIWFQPGSQLDYYPVKASVQWVQWHLWGTDTLGYHVTNVVLHLLSALLLWRLFAKLGLRLAWLGGLLFAVHPVMVESVAWIAELKNTLALPPFLLAIRFYLDYDEHGRRRDYLLALGLFLVAMLCKPTMVMFPVVILLYAWWKRDRIGWKDVKASAPFFVISLVLGLLTLLVGIWFRQLYSAPVQTTPLDGFFPRLVLAGLSISFYFSKAILPTGLLPIYPQWVVSPPTLIQFLPWPILAGVIYGLWAQRRSWGRPALLGLGFFLITLTPFVSINVSGYTKFTWVMDHFLYIPIIGLIGLAVAGLGEIEARMSPSLRPCGIGLVALVMIVLAWQSHAHAEIFVNEEALWTYTIEHNPKAWPARNNLGYLLMGKGRVGEAMVQFSEALRLKPDYVEAHNNLGFALVQVGQPAEAIKHFQAAVLLRPDYAGAHYNWGAALIQMGQVSEGIGHYQEALRLKPDFADVHQNWGNLLLQEGRFSEAIGHYQEALRINPDDAVVHYNYGNALMNAGLISEAISQYREAVRLRPDFAEGHNNFGNGLFQEGRIPEAIEHFQEALRLNPDYAEAHDNLGGALAQMGRWSEAIEHFQSALKIKPGDAVTHFVWGNALLRAGRLSDAIEHYREAVRINPGYANAHGNWGVALGLMGRTTEAIKQLQEASHLDPTNPVVRNNLAKLQASATTSRGK